MFKGCVWEKGSCFLKQVVHPVVDGKWIWGRGYETSLVDFMLKWVQDWGLMSKIIFELKQVNEGRPDCSYTWTELCQILLLRGLLTKFLRNFLKRSSVLALFLCTGIIAFIGWPVDDVFILLSNRMCSWALYHANSFVFECTYIPWIQTSQKWQ